ncbi:CoA-binding protein [Salinisphaera orenii MK-B5]|uniref:CoA-binding protein n=1 Tax=Salinisphaera orenii MK-B5 TaxID=856730 RepID=A0A423PHC6_9GAMM|nr:acetate--CoA ligase family protein [Salinisphaera orenii]ROO24990.1 CoA-binding protein [Salinisphaera orenii MK-B5]
MGGSINTAHAGDAGRSDDRPALARMFAPRSVALVGVSGRPGSTMARPLTFLVEHGFAGEIHPVNPNYDEIDGHPCHPSLDAVPGPVDLVLVMVPAARVIEVVHQAGAVGAAGVIVFASGFGETGDAGADLQTRLRDAAREAGVRVLGPNCQGLLYAPASLCATFTSAAVRARAPREAGVAYVGQSGAIGGSILDLANEMGLGLTAWASTGNQADLDLVEVARALVDDDAVRVIMLYVEAVGDGAAYTDLARAAFERGKTLVVLRSGRSAAGQRAAASHTGAMLGNDAGFRLVSQRFGVIQVEDLDELLAVAAARAALAPMRGRRIAVVTTSGGAGSLAADRCAEHGLALPELAPVTRDALAPLIPDFGALANPVDVTAQILGSDDAFGAVCDTVGADDSVDAVLVLLTMVVGDNGRKLARDLVRTAQALDKPILVAWLAGHDLTAEGRAELRAAGMPVFASVDGAVRAAARLAQAAVIDAAPSKPRIDRARLDAVLAGGRLDGEALLDALTVSRPQSSIVNSAAAARAAVAALGAPAALKLAGGGLDHKSDIGGVRLGVSAEAAEAAYESLMAAARAKNVPVAGVQVQSMIESGVELVIGATAAAEGFPPIVTVGLGGVTTELYRDTASALAPIDADGARALLRRLRAWPLLDGFRGAPPADVDAAVDVIVRVSEAMAFGAGRIGEFEINPLIVAAAGRGAMAVDVLVSPPAAVDSRDD